MGVIDFSLYLRTSVCEVNSPGHHPPESADMTTVLDQKNYIEELNRHLKWVCCFLIYSFLVFNLPFPRYPIGGLQGLNMHWNKEHDGSRNESPHSHIIPSILFNESPSQPKKNSHQCITTAQWTLTRITRHCRIHPLG